MRNLIVSWEYTLRNHVLNKCATTAMSDMASNEDTCNFIKKNEQVSNEQNIFHWLTILMQCFVMQYHKAQQ